MTRKRLGYNTYPNTSDVDIPTSKIISEIKAGIEITIPAL